MLRLRCPSLAWLVGIASSLSLALSPDALSQSTTNDLIPEGVGSKEIWIGVDAGPANWLAYTGGTYAPWGDIHGDGFRVRSTTGYGKYSYYFNTKTKVDVDKMYADVLLGYQQRFGELTAKAFLGWALLDQTFQAPSQGFNGRRVVNGAKGALELWLNLGDRAWTSLDLAYADTRATWSVRSRAGYRILPTISLGIEAAFNRTDLTGEIEISKKFSIEGNNRMGGFARYEWFGGEISAAVGLAGDWIDPKDGADIDLLHNPSVYGTLNLIKQF
jgi:hypothetical protein